MPSNDTENIYATQYGGEGEPIPASKISYDGTGTSIEATTVQNAITEVDTDLQSTKEDVSDIKGVLRNGYLLVDAAMKIEVTADGVKTLGALMLELGQACLAAVQALSDKQILVPRMFDDSNKVMSNLGMVTYTNVNTSFTPAFQRVDTYTTQSVLYYAIVVSEGTPTDKYTTLESTPAITIADKTSDVVTADKKISITFYKYEKA